MVYSLAIAACTGEVRVYGIDRIVYTVLLRGPPVLVAPIVTETTILTFRIRSPTFAAFSLITLTKATSILPTTTDTTEAHRSVVAFFRACATSFE